MVNETIFNQSISFESLFRDFIRNLPPEASQSVATFITILEAAGIILIVYLVFMIVKTIFDIRSKIFIRKIWQKVNEIDDKLNKVLEKKGKKKSDDKDKQ